MSNKVHIRDVPKFRTLCGRPTTSVLAVPPSSAPAATCRHCAATLRERERAALVEASP